MARIYDNESVLWKEFKRGDRLAFAEIYDKYFPQLYAYGLKIIRSEEDTRDCLCDFFLYLWENKRGLADLEKIKYYLLKAFRNHAIHFLKKQQKRQIQEYKLVGELPDMNFDISDLNDEQLLLKMRKSYIKDLLNHLSKRQREIVFLRYFDNLTIKEVAQVLDIKEQSVLNHLQRIFKQLREEANLPVEFIISLLCLYGMLI